MAKRTADRIIAEPDGWLESEMFDLGDGIYAIALKNHGLAAGRIDYGLINARGRLFTLARTEPGKLGIWKRPLSCGALVSTGGNAAFVMNDSNWQYQARIFVKSVDGTPSIYDEKAIYVPKDIFQDGKGRYLFRDKIMDIRHIRGGQFCLRVFHQGQIHTSPYYVGAPWEQQKLITEWAKQLHSNAPLYEEIVTEEEAQVKEAAIAAMQSHPAYAMF